MTMIPTDIRDDWNDLFTRAINARTNDYENAEKYMEDCLSYYKSDMEYAIAEQHELPKIAEYFEPEPYAELVMPTQLTIGFSYDTDTDTVTEWSYQTGDNSYTGGAYSFRHWIVLYISHETVLSDLWQDVHEQIDSLTQ